MSELYECPECGALAGSAHGELCKGGGVVVAPPTWIDHLDDARCVEALGEIVENGNARDLLNRLEAYRPVAMVAGAQSGKTEKPPDSLKQGFLKKQLIDLSATIAAGIRASGHFPTDTNDESARTNSRELVAMAVQDAKNILKAVD